MSNKSSTSHKPVRDSFLVFGQPLIEDDEIQEVVDSLKSRWLGTGPKVHKFEEDFKNYIGCQHALALNSCTAGLFLALETVGVGQGDEVIVPPMTFAATANVVVHRGAKPVFVGVERDTMNIDPGLIEDSITPKTKAIIVVHMTGRPCKMDEILDIAHRRNLFIIEDAAHAVETQYRDKKIGNIGDIGVFSFYSTKNVVTGEGGMNVTDNDNWAEEMRIKSLHGMSKDAWKRYSASGFQPYDIIYPGYKFNMMDIQAALGIHQLARVEKNLKIREKHWKTYNSAFEDMPEIIIPIEENGIKHARHLYTILIKPEMLSINRNQFISALKDENIGTGIHFIALHLHKYYRETFGYKRGDFPNAEFISDRTISLPLSAGLSSRDIDDVICAVKRVVESNIA